MLSKENKNFLIGVVVFVIVAFVSNVIFQYDLLPSVVAAIVVGVIAGLIADKIQK